MKIFLLLPLLMLGRLTECAAQLYLQSGAVLKTTNNAVITLQDIDLINNGTISQQIGEGRFVFAGSSNNNISGNSNPLFDIFEIAKTGTAKILLSQNINIGTSVNFTSGLIDLNNNNILLQPTALLNGENENSRITGISAGYIEITSTLNAPSAMNAGNLGAVITSPQNLGTSIIHRSHVPVTTGANSGIQRTFFISPSNNSSLNATFRFYYLDAELNGKNKNTLGLWKSTDGNTWSLVGADNRDATNNYVEKNSIADLSYWTLSDALNPLPLVLLSFSAICENNFALVRWETSIEQNIDHFVIQKSEDGSLWNDVGYVPAQNISSGAKYDWKDFDPSGHAFYRLKIFEFSGSYSLSPIFSGGCNDISMPFTVYPNPTDNAATVRISVRQNTKAELMLMNASGEILELHDWYLQVGVNTFSLLNIPKLASGTYIVRLLLNGNNFQQKLIKK